MPKIIIETPKVIKMDEFLKYWKDNVKTQKIDSFTLNEAYSILYNVIPKNNCSTCLRNRAIELKKVYDSNKHRLDEKPKITEVNDDIKKDEIVKDEKPTTNNKPKRRGRKKNGNK